MFRHSGGVKVSADGGAACPSWTPSGRPPFAGGRGVVVIAIGTPTP